MGLLDRFVKKEKMNMETGRFEQVRKPVKELTYEEQMNTPVNRRRQRVEQRKAERRELRRLEHEAYQKSFQQARLERAKKRGRTAGSTTWFERFEERNLQPREASYPQQPMIIMSSPPVQETPISPPSRRSSYEFSGMPSFNFDSFDNFGFFNVPKKTKRRKKSSKKRQKK